MSRQILIALAGALLVGVALAAYELATRPWPGSDGTAAPGETADPELAQQKSAPTAETTGEAPALPGPGDLRVELEPSGELTLLANNVPRARVLRALARAFEFELADHVRRHRRVTVALVRKPLERVLAQLLSDTPYTLSYASDAAGSAFIARLTVGEAPIQVARAEPAERREEERERRRRDREDKEARRSGDDPDAGSGDGDDAGGSARRSYTPPSAEERERMLAGRAVRQQLRRQELIEEDLVNPDPEERKIALGTLDPDLPEDLALLRTAIENDPDPGVRAEAALQLGFGERSNVTGVLQKALADTDSEVLINALESAAWVEDRSAKFRVKKLLDHPDEDVREAAADALRDLK